MPPVSNRLAARAQFVAPGIFLSYQPPARSIFPFGLSWQTLTGPLRIACGIAPGNLTHRLVRLGLRGWSIRMPPIYAINLFPHTRLEIQDAGPAELFRFGPVGCGGDKFGELGDCDLVLVHPERADRHLVFRRFVRHTVVRTHQERAALDEHHAVMFNRICANRISRSLSCCRRIRSGRCLPTTLCG